MVLRSTKDSPEHKQALAQYLHRVARETRQSAAEMDQWAGRIERRLRPEDQPIPCCEPGPCMICGADSPPGHVHVLLPDSRNAWQLPIGRICSSHTFWEAARADKFLVYVEGETDESPGNPKDGYA
jgi:hypothetical protein